MTVEVRVLTLNLLEVALFANDVGGELMELGKSDDDVNNLVEDFQLDLIEDHSNRCWYKDTANVLVELEKEPEECIGERDGAANLYDKFPFLVMYVLTLSSVIAIAKYNVHADDVTKLLADEPTRDKELAHKLAVDIQPFAEDVIKAFYANTPMAEIAHKVMSTQPKGKVMS